jgi:integrase
MTEPLISSLKEWGMERRILTDIKQKKDLETLKAPLLPSTGLTLSATDDRYVKAATADNTRKAYRSDVRHFERWGGLLPATTHCVISYLTHYAPTLNPRTLARRVTALKQWHLYQGFSDPTHHASVTKTLTGIARVHGQPAKKAHALTSEELERIVTYLNSLPSLAATRDIALLLIGYFGALRRSELMNLSVADFNWVEQRIDVHLSVSKTDQEHQGQYVALPYGRGELCPVTALKAWLVRSGIKEGYIFRSIGKADTLKERKLSPSAVNVILKKRANESGFKDIGSLSSHSFRRGVTTEASLAKASLQTIMRHGRWKSVKTVMEYIDAAERFTDNMATLVMKKKE